MQDSLNSNLPLSPAVLHILLALAEEDRHGYGIMQAVARQSEGKYKLGPGTLYDNLAKLLDSGIVQERHEQAVGSDSPRRIYSLTSFGRELLATEIARLESLVRAAKLHLATDPGGAK